MKKETYLIVPEFEPRSFDCRSTALTNVGSGKKFKLNYLIYRYFWSEKFCISIFLRILNSFNEKLFVFVVGKRKITSGLIFDVESESEIRISLSRQDFEIFEVMCSQNGGFR